MSISDCLDIEHLSFSIELVPSTISLLIISLIFTLSIKQFISRDLEPSIKIVYAIACIFSIVSITINIITCIFCMDRSKFGGPALILFWSSYYVVLFSILGILLLRLYFTFQESMFKITKFQQKIITVSYSFLLFWATFICILWQLIGGCEHRYLELYITPIGLAVGGSLYVGLRYSRYIDSKF